MKSDEFNNNSCAKSIDSITLFWINSDMKHIRHLAQYLWHGLLLTVVEYRFDVLSFAVNLNLSHQPCISCRDKHLEHHCRSAIMVRFLAGTL